MQCARSPENSLMPTKTSSSPIRNQEPLQERVTFHRLLLDRAGGPGRRQIHGGIDAADPRQQRLGQAMPAGDEMTTVVSEDCPAGPKVGCWNVAATKSPCRARGSRSNQRAVVLVSRTRHPLVFEPPSGQRPGAHRQRGQQRCPAADRAAGSCATDAGDRFHRPQRRIGSVPRNGSGSRPLVFRAWGRCGP